VLFVLLVGTGVYLVYRIGQVVVQASVANAIRHEVFTDHYPPLPTEVDGQLARVRKAYETASGWQLGVMLVDVLLAKAWNQPEGSSAEIHEALALGERYYPQAVRQQYSEWRGRMEHRLAWAYLYAGLPARLETWAASAKAASPELEPELDLMLVSGRITRDDLGGVQELIDEEFTKAPGNPENRALAVAGYALLGRRSKARELAAGLDKSIVNVSPNLQWYYTYYLCQEGQFDQAAPVMRELHRSLREGPDSANDLAVCVAGAKGVDDADVVRLAQAAAQSTREPRSLQGVLADIAAELYAWNPREDLARTLVDTAQAHPDDFDAQLALASAKLAAQSWEQYDENGARRALRLTAPGEDLLPSFDVSLEAAARLAGSPRRKRDVHLLRAVSLAQSMGGTFVAGDLDQSVRELRMALGDPAVPGAVPGDAPPEFETYLLDSGVRAARLGSKQFDTAVHRAVIDYLNRRRELFKGLDVGDKLEYAPAVAGQAPPAS
jgi:hypothetical protein